jgi:hypothetical protein
MSSELEGARAMVVNLELLEPIHGVGCYASDSEPETETEVDLEGSAKFDSDNLNPQ